MTYRLEGNPTPLGVGEFLDAVIADPDFQSGYNFIGDHRQCEEPDHTFIRGFAKAVRDRTSSIAPCRWAMVVSHKGAATAVHLLNILTFGCWVEFAAYLTLEEAIQWVDAGTAEWLALDDLR